MPPLMIPQDKLSFWQIRFVEELKDKDEAVLEFIHPYKRFATISLIPLEKVPDFFKNRGPSHGCYFFVIPNSVDIPPEYKESLDNGEWRKIILKEEKLFWQPGKAILQISASNIHKFFLSLIEFSFYEEELRKLETEINTNWPVVEKDTALTRQVNASDIKQVGHINEMTERVTLQRMRYVRMRSKLEDVPHFLLTPLKAFSSELLAQADTESRLDSVEGQLEIYKDVYELANDRISEFKFFHVEAKLEIFVILLLLAEVAIMILELFIMEKH